MPLVRQRLGGQPARRLRPDGGFAVTGHRHDGCMNESLTIDCDECVMQHTAACDDCVVTFICSREPGEALVIDVEELRAVRMLNAAGLVPELRHRARTG